MRTTEPPAAAAGAARADWTESPPAHRSRLRRAGARVLRDLLPLAILAALIGVWQLWVVEAHIRSFLLPTPASVFKELVREWGPVLAKQTWVTFEETILGFILGFAVGFLLAVGITYSRLLERVLYPPIVASQAVPKIAIAPLFVVWLGFGIAPKVVVTLLLVFFPIAVTSAQGLMGVDQNLVELLRSVGAGEWVIFRKVRLPYALPQIISGMKIGITLAVVGAVVGEWVGATAGLGYTITYAQSQLETTLTFAAIVILVVMGVVLFLAVNVLERLLVPWARSETAAYHATL
ncbi:MAG TPA: ABC transporter permease [Acidimicrobiales bacterium]|nr:ABC transporter permease [Acidimicrobiales bacterium]